MSTQKDTLLVTGASGHLGRTAIEWLLDHYEGSIIALTRHPEKLSDLVTQGLEVRQADFNYLEQLKESFAGVQRLLLISTDALAVPGQRLKQHQDAIQIAAQKGVKHIVYTSFLNPVPGTANTTASDHYGTEQALHQSGLAYTILRNNLYADNLLPSLVHAVKTGQYINAIDEGKVAYVTRNDCAIAAAVALAFAKQDKRTLNITGPTALSSSDIADILNKITGKSITYNLINIKQVEGMYEAFGAPPKVAQGLASFDTAAAKGEYEQVSPAFAELTGQDPVNLEQFLVELQPVLMKG
ncbi:MULTISPECIES: SDR family oxidoreductase [unclassified Paenibacillus]|uniref:SDR family oxidoreductase n=1 Tax=unclassified Paenibacillus TaxID=185978 RepID=UPI00383760F4